MPTHRLTLTTGKSITVISEIEDTEQLMDELETCKPQWVFVRDENAKSENCV